ncbi:MAG: hypothetical protein ACYS47_13595 [Planctomycetota bacterium]
MHKGAFFAVLLAGALAAVFASPVWALEKNPRWWWTLEDMEKLGALERKARLKGKEYVAESAHWIVKTEISKRFACEVALFMDGFHDTFEAVLRLPWKKRIKKKPTIIVLPSVTRYRKQFKDGSEGHYSLKFEEDECVKIQMTVFVRDPYEREFIRFYRPALLHEGSHLLLKQHFGTTPVPVWLTEGVATYFQFWDLKKRVFHNTVNRCCRSSFLLAYLKHRRMEKREGHDLDYLFGLTKKTWNRDRMGPRTKAEYGLAESLVDALLSSDEGCRLFRALVKRLSEWEEEDELFPPGEEERVKTLWEEHVAFLEEELLPKEQDGDGR